MSANPAFVEAENLTDPFAMRVLSLGSEASHPTLLTVSSKSYLSAR